MTSIATIAGALPAALAIGPGAETQRSMAIATYRSQITRDFDGKGGPPIVPEAMIADIDSADEVFWC